MLKMQQTRRNIAAAWKKRAITRLKQDVLTYPEEVVIINYNGFTDLHLSLIHMENAIEQVVSKKPTLKFTRWTDIVKKMWRNHCRKCYKLEKRKILIEKNIRFKERMQKIHHPPIVVQPEHKNPQKEIGEKKVTPICPVCVVRKAAETTKHTTDGNPVRAAEIRVGEELYPVNCRNCGAEPRFFPDEFLHKVLITARRRLVSHEQLLRNTAHQNNGTWLNRSNRRQWTSAADRSADKQKREDSLRKALDLGRVNAVEAETQNIIGENALGQQQHIVRAFIGPVAFRSTARKDEYDIFMQMTHIHSMDRLVASAWGKRYCTGAGNEFDKKPGLRRVMNIRCTAWWRMQGQVPPTLSTGPGPGRKKCHY